MPILVLFLLPFGLGGCFFGTSRTCDSGDGCGSSTTGGSTEGSECDQDGWACSDPWNAYRCDDGYIVEVQDCVATGSDGCNDDGRCVVCRDIPDCDEAMSDVGVCYCQ
jgi:hypothetical protein